jgi:glycosyltransferase involved in cell wall biosynthesis
MRILLIPPNDLLRHPIPNRMFHLTKRLAKGHEIFLLSYTKHPLTGDTPRRSFNGFEVQLGNVVKVRNLGLYYMVNAAQIYGAIRQMLSSEEIDVVLHANILPSLLAVKLAKSLGVPAVYDYLDYFPESASVYFTRGKWMVERGVWILTVKALRESTAVVVPSYGLRAVVREVVPSTPIYVIPNGVDTEFFKPLDRDSASRILGLDPDYNIVLLQGSIDVWIDVAEALKAIGRLREKYDVRGLIVGFSHGKQYFRQLLKYAKKFGLEKYIYRYPPQPYEKMPLFINASDLVYSPVVKKILNFATPLKIAEALSCGVPVVATDIPEYKLWYRQGVYTYRNYEELERVLSWVLNYIEELRENLRVYSDSFRERFSWDRLAQEYELVLEMVWQRSKNR